jgi:hypothetical protein
LFIESRLCEFPITYSAFDSPTKQGRSIVEADITHTTIRADGNLERDGTFYVSGLPYGRILRQGVDNWLEWRSAL